MTAKADFLRAAENDPNVQNPFPSLWMTCDFLVEWLNDHEVWVGRIGFVVQIKICAVLLESKRV